MLKEVSEIPAASVSARTLNIHRIGGGTVENLRLKPREATLAVPGISVLDAPTPSEAAQQMRQALPKSTELHEAAKTVGSTTRALTRSAGFDLIPMPRRSDQIDYEGELAVVIGRSARNVSREAALDYVLGYTIANDVTARDWQRDRSLGGGQFARGKSFDGFCPLGPCLVTRDEIVNPNALRLKTILNGRTMQDNTTADMIFDVPALIESLSSTMTLRPGAVLLTGTPQGVGMARTPPVWLRTGDTIAVEIEKIGRLENPVGPVE